MKCLLNYSFITIGSFDIEVKKTVIATKYLVGYLFRYF